MAINYNFCISLMLYFWFFAKYFLQYIDLSVTPKSFAGLSYAKKLYEIKIPLNSY